MVDRIDELELIALRSGRDQYSNFKLPELKLLKPAESAEIIPSLEEPTEQAAAIRWVLRGQNVEKAVAKVILDRTMTTAIRDKRRKEKEIREIFG